MEMVTMSIDDSLMLCHCYSAICYWLKHSLCKTPFHLYLVTVDLFVCLPLYIILRLCWLMIFIGNLIYIYSFRYYGEWLHSVRWWKFILTWSIHLLFDVTWWCIGDVLFYCWWYQFCLLEHTRALELLPWAGVPFCLRDTLTFGSIPSWYVTLQYRLLFDYVPSTDAVLLLIHSFWYISWCAFCVVFRLRHSFSVMKLFYMEYLTLLVLLEVLLSIWALRGTFRKIRYWYKLRWHCRWYYSIWLFHSLLIHYWPSSMIFIHYSTRYTFISAFVAVTIQRPFWNFIQVLIFCLIPKSTADVITYHTTLFYYHSVPHF